MHNHNKDGEGRGMIWMMIPCLLLVGFLFLGGGNLSSSGYLWPILIGVFVAAHVWMMFKGHGGTNTEDNIDNDSAKESDIKDEHKHSNGCH